MEIFKLLAKIFIDNKEANDDIDKTKVKVSEVSEKLKSGAETIAKWGAGIAAVATASVVAIGGLAESTREYRTEQAKLQTAFDEGGFSAEAARITYENLNGVLGDTGQAVEAANHLAKLVDTEADLAKWTNIATGVYATFGASLPIEGLTEAANETAKVGMVTGGLADALNWAGISEDEFNKQLAACNSEQERSSLITETLTQLYSGAAETYTLMNGKVIDANKAQDRLNASMAAVGAIVEPIITRGKMLVADVLERIIPLVEKLPAFVQENKTAITLVTVAVGALTAAVAAYTVAEKLKNLAVTAGVAAKGAGTVALGLHAAATTVATTATTAFGTAMAFLTSPITLVVAAIAALIAIIVLCVKHWDEIKETVINVWDKIKTAVSTAVEAVKNAISKAWDAIKTTTSNVWNAIASFFSNIWNGIKNTVSTAVDAVKTKVTNIWNAIKAVTTAVFNAIKTVVASVWTAIKTDITNAVNNVKSKVTNTWNAIETVTTSVWNGIKNAISNVVNAVKSVVSNGFNKMKSSISNILNNIKSTISNIWENIKTTIRDKISDFKDIGIDLVKGLWDGINDTVDWIIDKIGGFCSSVLSRIKGFFGIHSPSTVMRDSVGRELANGVAEGIMQNTEYAEAAAEELGQAILDSAQSRLDNYKVYNDLTLADEIAFWDSIRKECAEGTQARIDADEKYYEAKKTLDAKLADAEQEYRNAIEATRQKVKERTKEIVNAFQLFEHFVFEKKVDESQLIESLESQVSALRLWRNHIEDLREKIGDTDLFDAIEAMGIESLEQVVAINNMTETQLAKYVELYEERQQIAEQIAKSELADENAESIQTAYQAFSDKCAELGVSISATTTEMKNSLETAFVAIADMVGVNMEDTANSVSKSMSTIPPTVGEYMQTALKTITNALADMKTAFETFSPKMKMPHFKISGTLDVEAGTVPAVDVEWYARAMKAPVLLNSPTIFGYNAATGNFMGGGEAGSEVIAGTNTLMGMIREAVTSNSGSDKQLGELISLVRGFIDEFPRMMTDSYKEMRFNINNREFARLTKAVNGNA